MFHTWVGGPNPFRVEAMSGLSFAAMNASDDPRVQARVRQLVEGEPLMLFDTAADPGERKNLVRDPKYAADYKRVAEAGGFKITEDRQAILDWFKTNEIPIEQLETLDGLPVEVREDILAGKPGASKFHLNNLHKDRVREQSETKAAEARAAQEQAHVEYQSARSLAKETRSVFDEYVELGKAKGLDPGPLDGDFGSMTHAAVVSFQAARGLLIDGEVGATTARALGVKLGAS